MKSYCLLLALLFPLTVSASESAKGYSYEDGKGLLNLCQGNNNFNWGVCHSYLVAIHDVHGSFAHRGHLSRQLFCAPDGVSVGQLKRAFVDYAEQYPGSLHRTASSLVLDAYDKAFPC